MYVRIYIFGTEKLVWLSTNVSMKAASAPHRSRLSERSICIIFITKSKLLHKLTYILRGTSSTWLHKPMSCSVLNVCLLCKTENKRNSGTSKHQRYGVNHIIPLDGKAAFVICCMSLPLTASLYWGSLSALYTLKCSCGSADLKRKGYKNLMLNTRGEFSMAYNASYDTWLKGKGE